MSNQTSNTNISDLFIPPQTISSPYFDDWADSKGFLRTLFKPGVAVQARELTQLQTTLQAQVQRFGLGVFQNGSQVVGGKITYQAQKETISYVNLASTYANTAVVAAGFLNQPLVAYNVGNTASPRAWVVATQEATTTTPPTLIIKYNTAFPFSANGTVQPLNQNVFANVVSSGNSSVASINAGIYFFNGFFIRCYPQTIILDAYDNTPSYSVGLEYDDSIITSNDDASLLDPAQGASNYQAPGADRYQATLTLASRSLSSTDNTKFIELLRIQNGVITKQVTQPQLSDIATTMAQRTFDTNGNFTVKPFVSSLLNHIPEYINGTGTTTANTNIVTGANSFFLNDVSVNSILYLNNQSAVVNTISSNTSLTLSTNLSNGANVSLMQVYNPNKFTLALSKGKAYIQGYPFVTPSTTNLGIFRGRSYANVTSYDSTEPLGNYLFTSNTHGIPDISIFEQFDLHYLPGSTGTGVGSIDFTTLTSYGNTKIGTAKIRAHEYSSAANTSNGLTHIFKTYLFDVSLANTTYTMNNVMALATFDASGNANFNKKMDIDSSSKSNNNLFGNTVFSDTNFNILVYQFPQTTIVPGSITNIDYQYRKQASNVSFTAGAATLTLSSPENFLGSGALSDSQKLSDFTVTLKNAANMPAGYANGDILPMTTALGRSITVSPATSAAFNTNLANNFICDVQYSVTISGSPAPVARVKTLISSNTSNVAITGNTFVSNTNTSVYLANGQIQVTQKNNIVVIPGVSQNLYICDIVSLDAVYDFLGAQITQANLATASVITNNYSLDNGQRDNYYAHGSIKIKPGSPSPVGPLLICASYYSHSGTSGFLTVDSYPNVSTTAGYSNVSTYVSPTSGVAFNLRDCIDWRPVKTNAVDTTGSPAPYVNPRILEPGQFFISNFSYYLPRMDKIVLTKDQTFKVIQGVPAQYPVAPNHNSTDMLLYTLTIPAYTFTPGSVSVLYNNNKRYTMAAIGALEQRISNLEYYTSLNLLEQAAAATTSVNANTGISNFQNGIIVDDFNGHSIGDVTRYDYQCSMDFQNGGLLPMFASNNALFNVNAGGSTNFFNGGGQITLSYTIAPVVTQNTVSEYTTVNLFGYTTAIGTLTLIPDNDTWYNIQQRPQVLVNLDGSNDAWEALTNSYNASGAGTQYSDWTTNWTGIPTVTSTVVTQGLVGGNNPYAYSSPTVAPVTVQNITTPGIQTRTVTTSSIVPETITQDLGSSVISTSLLPYIRESDIAIFSNTVKPLAIYYPFFDNKNMSAYWMNPLYLQVAFPTTGFFSTNTQNEIITSTSGGTALILAQPMTASLTGNTTYPYVVAVNVKGPFNANDIITGSVSGATATVQQVIRSSDNCTSYQANSYLIALNTSANFSNTSLVGFPISTAKGNAEGQITTIVAWDNVGKVATVANPFTPNPSTDTIYNIGFPFSNPLGVVMGNLHIPDNTALEFFAGEKSVRLTTDPTNSTTGVASYADGAYFAQGILETTQDTIISTRVPTIVQATSTQSQTISTTSVVVNTPGSFLGLVSQVGTPPPNTQPTMALIPGQSNYFAINTVSGLVNTAEPVVNPVVGLVGWYDENPNSPTFGDYVAYVNSALAIFQGG